MDNTAQKVKTLSALLDIKNTIKFNSSVVENLETVLNKRSDSPELPISSLQGLNRKLWGLKRKELVVLGARNSNGKSSLALQIAWDMFDAGKRVIFMSLEMTEEELMERLFCNVMSVDNYDLLVGKYKENDVLKQKYSAFKELVKRPGMFFTCGVGKTFIELNDFLEPLNADIIIVDYIQAIKVSQRYALEDISEYVRRFRELCLKKNFCGVLVSQINRDAKNDQPENYQLKSSGTLEESADKIMLLHWEYHYKNNPPQSWSYDKQQKYPNDMLIRITKNRNGRTGEYRCIYEPQYYKFSDYPE